MKIIIRQCKYCPEKISSCSKKEEILTATKGILKKHVAVMNCPNYKLLYRTGDKVMIDMHNERFNEGGAYWEKAGRVTGVIKGRSIFESWNDGYGFVESEEIDAPIGSPAIVSQNKFYIVELIAPMKVTRVDFTNRYIEKEIEITHIKKTANAIYPINWSSEEE